MLNYQVNKSNNVLCSKLRNSETKIGKIVVTDMDRSYYTKHGLHFNKIGKHLFCNKIVDTIENTFSQPTSDQTSSKLNSKHFLGN